MKKAIIFDYDDTLVMTRSSKFAAIKELAKRYYDTTFTDQYIDVHWGKPFELLFSGLFDKIDSNTELVIDRYHKVTFEFPMKAYPESLKAIDRLLEEDNLVGILTSANRSVVIPDLKSLKFPVDRFALIQTADDTNVHKPSPKVFTPTIVKLAEMGIESSQITYVGDSVDDFNAAFGAKLNFIGIARDSNRKLNFDKLGAKHVSCLSEIK